MWKKNVNFFLSDCIFTFLFCFVLFCSCVYKWFFVQFCCSFFVFLFLCIDYVFANCSTAIINLKTIIRNFQIFCGGEYLLKCKLLTTRLLPFNDSVRENSNYMLDIWKTDMSTNVFFTMLCIYGKKNVSLCFFASGFNIFFIII